MRCIFNFLSLSPCCSDKDCEMEKMYGVHVGLVNQLKHFQCALYRKKKKMAEVGIVTEKAENFGPVRISMGVINKEDGSVEEVTTTSLLSVNDCNIFLENTRPFVNCQAKGRDVLFKMVEEQKITLHFTEAYRLENNVSRWTIYLKPAQMEKIVKLLPIDSLGSHGDEHSSDCDASPSDTDSDEGRGATIGVMTL